MSDSKTSYATAPWQRMPFHVMTKPVGPLCNLDCTYCFYLEKEKLYGKKSKYRMADGVLDKYIREFIQSQSAPEISFAWQGGEPTLLGVDFFRKVVDLQQQHSDGRPISNAFQTNGTLLNDEWCEFLAENRFLVGLSVDGPAELHDAYRVDKGQRGSFERVMRGLQFLQKHKVEYNTLTVVNRKNSKHPLKVYRFLKEIGSTFLQFIPIVERKPDSESKELGLDLASPPAMKVDDEHAMVTPWSVTAVDYGNFLTRIFDAWVKEDVGQTFVQAFDVALSNWMGLGGALCVFSEKCGRALALEHNGDLYSCDHFVYPKYHLGNIMESPLGELVDSPQQKKFGSDKLDTLPRYCLECPVRFACHGECPKHRFIKTPSGEPGLNYLCAGYKKFFTHIDPYMRVMARLLNEKRPASEIMPLAREWNGRPPKQKDEG